MKKTLTCVIATFFFGVVSFAQEPPPKEAPQDDSAKLVLRGCLTKGGQAQKFMMADEESGKKVSFDAPPKLESYVNQTVELTGRVVDRGGERAFQPEAVKSLSPSCKDMPKK